jgi:hypothetical protein
MRKVVGAILIALLSAAPALAQNRDEGNEHRFVKVVIGAGALAIGAAVAAKSSESTKTTSAVGSSETSSFSTSQLVTGLVIAGTGGILLWDGLRDHHRSSPSTVIGIAPAARLSGGGVFLRRSW